MGRAVKGKPDRDLMLSAAESLFAEQGFGACSLRDVLGAMKCSTTAFYSRFGSKDDVFEELVAGLIGDLYEAAGGALTRARSEVEAFEIGLEVLVGTLLPRKRFVGVALSEGSCSDGSRAVLRESFELLAGLLETQLRLVADPAPKARAWAVVGALHMQVFRWAVLGDVSDDDLASNLRAVVTPLMPITSID